MAAKTGTRLGLRARAWPLTATLACMLAVACAGRHPREEIRPNTRAMQERAPRAVVPQGRSEVTFTPYETDGADPLRLTDQPLAYPQVGAIKRPRPLLELGDPFLGTGPIRPGLETPTGQVIQPWLLLYGTFRSAMQTFDGTGPRTTELATRLDLHGNLSFSGTERLVFSFRPLDSEDGGYTGFNFEPDEDDGYVDNVNLKPTALFFEGEFGEIFPSLDRADKRALDWGFSVGRQPLVVQDGLLVDANVDLVGVTRNSKTAPGVSNLRLTGVFGWNGVDRTDNREQKSGHLLGLLSAADVLDSTVSFDLLFVADEHDRTDAWYLGAASTQRLGELNTTFRAAASIPVHDDTPAAGAGTMLFVQLAHDLRGPESFVYWNSFWSLNDFSSAARDNDRGDAASGTGMLFEPVGMGRYGIPLGGPIEDTIGTALGTQLFLNGIRQQLVLEVGARASTAGTEEGSIGVGARYQRALGHHHILRLDAFAAAHEHDTPTCGGRVEWLFDF